MKKLLILIILSFTSQAFANDQYVVNQQTGDTYVVRDYAANPSMIIQDYSRSALKNLD